MEVVVTTGVISHVNLQSNHHQQTNTQFFKSRMPFLSPIQQCQSTEGNICNTVSNCKYIIMQLVHLLIHSFISMFGAHAYKKIKQYKQVKKERKTDKND